MTPKEKQLLLKDLCARLPYKPIVQILNLEKLDKGRYNEYLSPSKLMNMRVFEIKPYLRPMSSMTEEERIELKKLCEKDLSEFAGFIQEGHGLARDGLYMFDKLRQLDFLNSHGFDYRGLIPMGLALEAKKGMYK